MYALKTKLGYVQSFVVLLFMLHISSVSLAKEKNQSVGINLSVFEDEASAYSRLDYTIIPFKKVANSTLNFGFYKGTIWIKLQLKKGVSKQLLIKNANLDCVDFYALKQGGLTLLKQAGDSQKTKLKSDKRYPEFNLNHTESKVYYLRIKNKGDQLFIPLIYGDLEQFTRSEKNENLLLGLYFGLSLFVLILNFSLYRSMKEKINLFYVGYIVCFIGLQIALSGLGNQFIWKESTYFANHSLPFFSSLSVAFLTAFVVTFLDLKSILNKSFVLLKITILLLLCNAVLAILPIEALYRISMIAVNVITLLINIAIIPISIYAYRKKVKGANYFVFAFSILILCVFVFILRNFGIIASNVFVDYSLYIGSGIEMIILSLAIVEKFKAYRNEALENLKSLNELIDRKNIDLEIQVKERTLELEKQKEIVSEKNSEIVQSFNYASRIQNSLNPSEFKMNAIFPEAFILYKPKDILSGDFYWVNEVTTTSNTQNLNLKLFAVGDCTGHGVPGAMLSVLGLKILNDSLTKLDINSTSEALDFVNHEFNKTFKSIENDKINDGMDIALCALDASKGILYFSGAKNGVTIVRNNEIFELKGDNQAIGMSDDIKPFNANIFQLEKNDMIYLYSDGFQDQFGGDMNKKFKSRPLKNLFIEIAGLDANDQRNKLERTFESWKGSNEQTDDVCILGIRY